MGETPDHRVPRPIKDDSFRCNYVFTFVLEVQLVSSFSVLLHLNLIFKIDKTENFHLNESLKILFIYRYD